MDSADKRNLVCCAMRPELQSWPEEICAETDYWPDLSAGSELGDPEAGKSFDTEISGPSVSFCETDSVDRFLLGGVNPEASTGSLSGLALGLVNRTRFSFYGLGLGLWNESEAGEMRGMHIAGLVNRSFAAMEGLQVAAFVNLAGGEASGIQIAGLANSLKMSKGLQAALFLNMTDDFAGFQVAGIANLASSMSGLQISPVANFGGGRGVQVAGFGNYAEGVFWGAQISFVINYVKGSMKGLQTSFFGNMSEDEMSGLQIAQLANFSGGDMTGVQIALVANSSRGSMRGVQIAMLNYWYEGGKRCFCPFIRFACFEVNEGYEPWDY